MIGQEDRENVNENNLGKVEISRHEILWKPLSRNYFLTLTFLSFNQSTNSKVKNYSKRQNDFHNEITVH